MDGNHNLFAAYAYGQMDRTEALNFDNLLIKDDKLRYEFECFLDKISAKLISKRDSLSLLHEYLIGKLSNTDKNLFVNLIRFKKKWEYSIKEELCKVFNKYSDGNQIIIFDEYVNNNLPVDVKNAFDLYLKTDEEFASDFKVYLMTVDGICREARQNDMDFGVAMKKLSKEQLRDIVSPRQENEGVRSSDKLTKPKGIRIKTWMWQVASIAAVIVIAFTAVFKIEQNSRNNVYDAIYACADINTDLARSGGETININTLTVDELKTELPTLINLYQTASTTDEIADNGYTLAMVYLKLHEPDKAAETLNQLISRFEGNEDYAESVNKWKSILNLIK